jgi:hypothetical protein
VSSQRSLNAQRQKVDNAGFDANKPLVSKESDCQSRDQPTSLLGGVIHALESTPHRGRSATPGRSLAKEALVPADILPAPGFR